MGVRVMVLDCGLDASPGSRFHSTAERAKHICLWMETAGSLGGGSQGQVEISLLQGVYSTSARATLAACLSASLRLPHVLDLSGPGLLLGSRFPILWHRYFPFPKHNGCSHPAIRLPPGPTGGLLTVLLDASLHQKVTAQDPPRRLLVLASTVPDQPIIWTHLHASLSACAGPLSTHDPSLSATAALFLAKLERPPPLSPRSSFHPRDLLLNPIPPPGPPPLAAVLAGDPAIISGGNNGQAASIGTLSSARFPYTWDPMHNALAAQENQTDATGIWRAPCRVSALLALDWLLLPPAEVCTHARATRSPVLR